MNVYGFVEYTLAFVVAVYAVWMMTLATRAVRVYKAQNLVIDWHGPPSSLIGILTPLVDDSASLPSCHDMRTPP